MAIIKIKRGSTGPTGLTFGELAFDVNNKKLYFGVTSGSFLLTSPEGGVASFNGKTGAVQGVSAAAAGTGISVSGATGTVTITNTGVLSFNGNAGDLSVTYINDVQAGTAINVSKATVDGFAYLATVTNTGVRAFNGLTGNVSGVTTSVSNTFSALQIFNSGISGSGATFSGNVSAQSISNASIARAWFM